MDILSKQFILWVIFMCDIVKIIVEFQCGNCGNSTKAELTTLSSWEDDLETNIIKMLNSVKNMNCENCNKLLY